MGNYSDLYCRTDVLLLAYVFETFRKTCLRQYGLDPAHYYTSPGLSWDALLTKTGVELELLTDYDQHLFIERGMRGGISMVSKRHAKANNPLVDGYDPEKPGSHIQYLPYRQPGLCLATNFQKSYVTSNLHGFGYLQTSVTSKFNEFWLVTVVCHQQNLRVLASDRRLAVAIFSNIGW